MLLVRQTTQAPQSSQLSFIPQGAQRVRQLALVKERAQAWFEQLQTRRDSRFFEKLEVLEILSIG